MTVTKSLLLLSLLTERSDGGMAPKYPAPKRSRPNGGSHISAFFFWIFRVHHS